MAQYLALIYEEEAPYANADEATYTRVMQAHNEFGAKYQDAIKGGNALQPTTTATTIRTDASGTATVTDGPFLETKEALGGYYLIEADDLDRALEIAKAVPAFFGCVELRPVMVFS
jgi:hypothetical protein